MAICKNSNCKKEFTVPEWALEPVYAEFCTECVNIALKKNLQAGKTVEEVVKIEMDRHFAAPKTKEISKTLFSFTYSSIEGKPRTELFPSVEKMYSQVFTIGDIIFGHLKVRNLDMFKSQMMFEDRWQAEIIGNSHFMGWVEFQKHKVIFQESKRIKK